MIKGKCLFLIFNGLLVSWSVPAADKPRPNQIFHPQDLVDNFSEGLNKIYGDYVKNLPEPRVETDGTELLLIPKSDCFDSSMVFVIRRNHSYNRIVTSVSILCKITYSIDFIVDRQGHGLSEMSSMDVAQFRFPKVTDQESMTISYLLRKMKISVFNPPSGLLAARVEVQYGSQLQTFRYQEQKNRHIFGFLFEVGSSNPVTFRIEAHPSSISSKLFERRLYLNGKQFMDPPNFYDELKKGFSNNIRSLMGL